jgi:hypothetical protein
MSRHGAPEDPSSTLPRRQRSDLTSVHVAAYLSLIDRTQCVAQVRCAPRRASSARARAGEQTHMPGAAFDNPHYRLPAAHPAGAPCLVSKFVRASIILFVAHEPRAGCRDRLARQPHHTAFDRHNIPARPCRRTKVPRMVQSSADRRDQPQTSANTKLQQPAGVFQEKTEELKAYRSSS